LARGKKGKLEEVISKALYGDITSEYTVVYRDMKRYPEIPLSDFLKNGEIPFSRIIKVKRSGKIVWERNPGNYFYTRC
jgi:uncharacterized protein (UPF0248 family)